MASVWLGWLLGGGSGLEWQKLTASHSTALRRVSNGPAHTISPLLSVFDGSAPATAVTSVISTLSGVHSGHGKATPTALEESRLIPVSIGSQGLIRVRPDSIGSRLNRRDQGTSSASPALNKNARKPKLPGVSDSLTRVMRNLVAGEGFVTVGRSPRRVTADYPWAA